MTITTMKQNYQRAVHLDGARLWQCEQYYQRSFAEICALFDVFPTLVGGSSQLILTTVVSECKAILPNR